MRADCRRHSRAVCIYNGAIVSPYLADSLTPLMIYLSQATGFQWDDGNARKNLDSHDVSQDEAEQVFSNQPLLIVDDTAHSQQERRFSASGISSAGRRLHVTFTMRNEGSLIRVISARDMSRRERERYGQET